MSGGEPLSQAGFLEAFLPLARAAGLQVILVTKGRIEEGATSWAQGGIAAAVSRNDSPDAHAADTVAVAGGIAVSDQAPPKSVERQTPWLPTAKSRSGASAHFAILVTKGALPDPVSMVPGGSMLVTAADQVAPLLSEYIRWKS